MTISTVIKRFDPKVYPTLSAIVDSIVVSLQCPKFQQLSSALGIYTVDEMKFALQENKQMVEKGFAACVIQSQNAHIFRTAIVVNVKNCITAHLTEGEITAVIYHVLGHILNKPELEPEPTFEFCFIHHMPYSAEVLKRICSANSLREEIYADLYAKTHGYGTELISTFHKQNEHFEQKIGYCDTRTEWLQRKDCLERESSDAQG